MSGYERVLPLSISPYHFVGTKPVAVLFGEERVEVKSWRQVYITVIGRCNQEWHENLMYLRDKAAGKVRVFLSASPDGMTRPVRIDEDISKSARDTSPQLPLGTETSPSRVTIAAARRTSLL